MCFVERRRREGRLAVLALLSILVACVAAAPQPVQAQSFFEQLFGLSPPKQQSAPTIRASLPAIGGKPTRLQQAYAKADPDETEPPRRNSRSSEQRSGSYRTVCVRTCDGFYFPISNTASRANFHDDANQCRARCGTSEARLFYHTNSAEIGEAVDLAGHLYKNLSTAFLYRKKLVDGCACKPMPWSATEIDRHRQYAIAEGRIVPPLPAERQPVSVIAGKYSTPAGPRVAQASAAATLDGLQETEEPPAMQPQPVVRAAAISAAAIGPPRSLIVDDVRVSGAVRREAKPQKRQEAKTDAKSEANSEAKPDPKPRATPKPVKTASTQTPPVPPQPRRAPGPTATAANYVPQQAPFGLSGGKYTWPGDGPSRYR